MTKDQAVEHFGTQVALAAALKMHQSTVCAWDEVPALRQIQLERLTGGKLKADPECWGAALNVEQQGAA
jgi:hypothetical protein